MSSNIDPRKTYGSAGLAPIVLGNCGSVLVFCLVKVFRLFYQHLPFLPAGSLSTFNLFLGRMAAPVLQTTDLQILVSAFLVSFSLSLTGGLSSISMLTIIYLNVSKDSTTRQSTCNLLGFITEYCSSSFRVIGQTLAVALEISIVYITSGINH